MDKLVHVQMEFAPIPLVIFGREQRGEVEYRFSSLQQMRIVLGAMWREHQHKTIEVTPYLYGLTAYRIPPPAGE